MLTYTYEDFAKTKIPYLDVIERHHDDLRSLTPAQAEISMIERAKEVGFDEKLFMRILRDVKKELKGQETADNALEVFTIEALESELPALDIWPVWDDIAATIRYGTNARNERATVPTMIYSALCGKYRAITPRIITSYLTNIALKNHKNPIIEYLNDPANMWDGKDRFEELYRILGVSDDDLSKTLIRKWFWQGYALLLNGIADSETFGADGLLVLTGDQGIGKTSFFRWAACKNDWFKDGCTLSKDKDEERRIVTCWIAELGEIGRTLRGDLDSLKAFVTRDFDRYRLPYAATDTENPRHTNLCGTVNGSDGFLIDQTGNRRFWTVPLESIDLPALRELDAVQIWEQIAFENALVDRQGFRLTREERKALEMRNAAIFMKKGKGFEEVEDLITTGTEFELMTATEWKEREPTLRGLSTKAIGGTLQRLGVEAQTSRKGSDGKMKRGRFYLLPIRYGNAP